MNKNVDQIITESASKGIEALEKAINGLLSEELKAGDTVAVVDDPAWPLQGVKGKVRGPSAKGSGFVDVEAPNGMIVPCQANLVYKVTESVEECTCKCACGGTECKEKDGKKCCVKCGKVCD